MSAVEKSKQSTRDDATPRTGRDPTNRGSANAGKILGIVGTVFLGLGIIVGIVVLLFVVVASTEVSSLG
ncbi:MAG: hypothetical protein V3S32_09500 [Acidimicrobiia bacterium]